MWQQHKSYIKSGTYRSRTLAEVYIRMWTKCHLSDFDHGMVVAVPNERWSGVLETAAVLGFLPLEFAQTKKICLRKNSDLQTVNNLVIRALPRRLVYLLFVIVASIKASQQYTTGGSLRLPWAAMYFSQRRIGIWGHTGHTTDQNWTVKDGLLFINSQNAMF